VVFSNNKANDLELINEVISGYKGKMNTRGCLSFVAVPAGGYFLLLQGGKFK